MAALVRGAKFRSHRGRRPVRRRRIRRRRRGLSPETRRRGACYRGDGPRRSRLGIRPVAWTASAEERFLTGRDWFRGAGAGIPLGEVRFGIGRRPETIVKKSCWRACTKKNPAPISRDAPFSGNIAEDKKFPGTRLHGRKTPDQREDPVKSLSRREGLGLYYYLSHLLCNGKVTNKGKLGHRTTAFFSFGFTFAELCDVILLPWGLERCADVLRCRPSSSLNAAVVRVS